MAISIQCPGCRGQFQAPEKLAGKQVKCPRCSAVIQVPGEGSKALKAPAPGQESNQPIPVACGCGKKFRAKRALAGKRVKCPGCGQVLAIPGLASPAGAPWTEDLDLDQLTGTGVGGAALPSGPRAQPKRKRQGANLPLIVGLGAGAAVLVLTLVLVITWWLSGDDEGLATKVPAPGTGPPEARDTIAPPAPPPPGGAPSRPPPGPDGTRPYPAIPGAVTEPPDWLAKDAPFDVVAFFEAPPPEQNAAPLYLDALYEFGSELEECFPEEERTRRSPTVRQRETRFGEVYTAWRKDPHSVDAATMDALIAEYDTGLKKLALAQERQRCVFETGINLAALLPHAHVARQVARVVEMRAARDLARGDFDRAIEGVERVLRLSRDLRRRGPMISQLVSIATDGILYRQTVPRILAAPGITTGDSDRLATVLQEHEQGVEPFLEGLRFEYLMSRSFLYDVEHHTGIFDPKISRGHQWADFMAVIDGPSPEKGDPQARNEAAKRIDDFLAKMTPADFQRQVDLLNRFYRSAAEPPEASLRERAEAAEGLGREAVKNKMLIALTTPTVVAFSEAVIRHQTFHPGTKCLVALRRWQIEHAGSPPDLAAVVKAAGMNEVPMDPYSDQPFRMTTIAGQPVVYSVGRDGKDDKGLLEWDFNPRNPQGDILFRLSPPP